MLQTEKAKVFRNGRSQAVRIPAEFRFTAGEVYIRRNPVTGDLTLSEHPPKASLPDIFARLDAAGITDFELDRDLSFPADRDPV